MPYHNYENNKILSILYKTKYFKIFLFNRFEMLGSALSPVPFKNRLSSCSSIRSHVFSLIHKFVMGIIVVVQDVEVSTIQEVTVFGIAEIDDSAFLVASIRIKHHNAMIAI